MKKKILIGILIVLVLGVLFYAVLKPSYKNSSGALGRDYKNASYEIDGQTIVLVNGTASFSVFGDPVARATVSYFGNEIFGDLNGDGRKDAAFILTQNNGGSGTFYYVVAAINTADGYRGTNGIFLGDRIAPQSTELRNGEVVVNYAQRKPGEPMTTKPSVGVSKYLKVSGGKLVEVQQ